MSHCATFNVPLDGLRRLLGLPENMQIIRCHALPNQISGGEDCLRLVVQSPDLPATPPGEEIPIVQPSYDLGGDTYRRFKGFSVVRMVVDQPPGAVDDAL